MPKDIIQVATTDIEDMMSPGTERRMELPGFAPEFVDFPHYIIRITERIWHDREVELCLDWYAEDCAIHTLTGPEAAICTPLTMVGVVTLASVTRILVPKGAGT